MIEVEIDESVFLPVYRPVIGSEADIIFFWGGRDSGKTQHIAQELIIKCLESDYFRCILIKKTYESIKDSQWQTIKEIVEEWGLSHLFIFREHPLEIICVNGNKFIARGCDKPEKMKSIRNPTDAWYEEMDQLTKNDHIVAQTTLRNNRGKVKEWCSFNPECEGDYEEFWLYKDWVGERYEHFREVREIQVGDETLYITVEGIHTTYDDNPYCTAQRKARHESLFSLDPYYYMVYRRGRWGKRAVKNPFALQFNPAKHVSDRAKFDPKRLIYISFDFNLEPFGFTFSHKWYDTLGAHCHQFDEGRIEAANLDKGLEWIKTKYGKFAYNFVITGDKMGDKRDFGERDTASYYKRIQNWFALRDNQIETHPNPEHKNSRDDVNYILAHFPDFAINPKCKFTISDLQNVQTDNRGKIIKLNRNDESQRSDFLDCVRYSCNDHFMQTWIRAHQRMT